MKVCRTVFVVIVAFAVLVVWMVAQPVGAQDRETLVETKKVTSDVRGKLDLGNARAIVAAKLKDDKPQAGIWPCRLIHSDPNLSRTDDFERHVGNKEFLLLINLSDEIVTFEFEGAFFDEGAGPFRIEPDHVKILRVKDRIRVKPGDSNAVFEVNGSEGCFDHLPGPFVLIP